MVNTKQLLQELGQYAPFENSEWQIRVRGSTDSDKRLMTFVDNLWGFEVTGGEFRHKLLNNDKNFKQKNLQVRTNLRN